MRHIQSVNQITECSLITFTTTVIDSLYLNFCSRTDVSIRLMCWTKTKSQPLLSTSILHDVNAASALRLNLNSKLTVASRGWQTLTSSYVSLKSKEVSLSLPEFLFCIRIFCHIELLFWKTVFEQIVTAYLKLRLKQTVQLLHQIINDRHKFC